MFLELNAQIFKEEYGLKNIISQLIILSISVDKGRSSPRDLILVVDLSSSMNQHIKQLKHGIMVLHDNLNIGIGFRLIIFSNTAQEIWPSTSKLSLRECINQEIYARNKTNLSDGIKLALEKIDSERPTWIVIMTDGIANMGEYQKPAEFKELLKMFPINATLITLGFGVKYCIKTLKILGSYNHLSDSDSMIKGFGGIVNEINNTWAFNAKIIRPNQNHKSRIVIGTLDIGSLYFGRNFTFGYLPFGDQDLTLFSGEIKLNYHDLSLQKNITLTIPVTESKSISESIKKLYYQASKGRLLEILTVPNIRETQINFIKERIKLWDPILAKKEIEEIEYYLNNINNLDLYYMNGYIEDITRQHSYQSDIFQTQTQKETIERVLDSYRSQTEIVGIKSLNCS
jgi:von Willebrand factor type A domain